MKPKPMLAAWTCLALAACAEGPPAHTATEAERWTLAEARVFSPSDEAPLTAVHFILPTGHGQLLVVDGRTPAVLRFDTAGSYLGRVGGEGDGPGEFRRVVAIGLLGDTLWVADGRHYRTTRFVDGRVVGTAEHLEAARARFPHGEWELAGVLADGAPLVAVLDTSHTVFSFERLEGLRHTQLADTRWGDRNVRVVVPGVESYLRNPWPTGDLVALAPDGSQLAVLERPVPTHPDSAAYHVRVLNPHGAELWRASVRYDPVPVPSSEVDAWVARQVDGERSPGAGLIERGVTSRGAWERAVRQAFDPPAYEPPTTTRPAGAFARTVRAAAGDVVWVERETGRWDVVEPAGRSAVVDVPGDAELLTLEGDHVWGTRTDELGVPTIVRWRVVRGGAG
ncbi:MAG: 6-bladed beta-propeller [Gemmatimonadota bacterium]